MKKVSRKILSAVTALVLMLGVLMIYPVATESVIAVKTDRESYLQGETVTAQVYFPAQYNEIASLDLSLMFDISKLEIISVNSAPDLTNALNEQTNGKVFSEGHSIPGFVKWSVAGSNNFNFRGTFAIVKFTVKAKAASGNTDIKLRVDNAANSGYVNKTEAVTVNKASITVIPVGANELAFDLNDNENGYDVVTYNCKEVDSVAVPAVYAGLPVTGIADNVFSKHSELKQITLPDTIRTIGNKAFEDCTGLEKITMRDPVDSIGYGAFKGCSSLKSVVVPVGVEEIKEDTFNGCAQLETVVLPFTVTKIGNNVFKDCTTLAKVKISKNTTDIADNSFDGCENVIFNTVAGNTYLPGYIASKFSTATISEIKDLSLGTATTEENVQYTGSALSPVVRVTLMSGETVSRRTDYDVAYKDNVATGKATVYVFNSHMDGYGEGYKINFNIICNHKYDKTLAKKATCTADGYYDCLCTICGHTTTETIKATGHTEGEWIIDSRPTLYKTGLKHTCCTVCREYVQRNVIIPKAFPDLNGDKFINSADALTVLMYSIGMKTDLTTQELLLNADTDGNGNINSADALAILQIAIGQKIIEGYTA